MDDTRVGSVRSLLHPAIAVLMPFAFLQAMDAVVRLGIASGQIPTPTGWLAVVLLTGVSRTIVANILGQERISGALPVMRELLLTLAAGLVLLTFLAGRPFNGVLSPLQPDIAWPLFFCIVQWMLTRYVQNALRARELFLHLVAGRTGHALAMAAREAGGEAGQSQLALDKLRNAAVLFEAITLVPYGGLLTVLSFTGGTPPAFGITARVFSQALAGIAFMVVFGGFSDEQICIASGVPRDARAAIGRFLGPIAGVSALFVGAIALAGGGAIAPLSLLARLLAWLQSLVPASVPRESVPPPQPAPEPQSPPLSDMMGLPGAKENPMLAEVVRIVFIVLAVAAGAVVVFLLVRPLFKRETLAGARKRHPLRLAARRAAELLRALARLPGAFARWLRTPGKGFAQIPRAILQSIRESVSDASRETREKDRASRMARSRAVREFFRLARWGEKTGVSFRGSEGPMEYAVRLAGRAPSKGDLLREAARLFEELVYSEAPEGRGERALARLVDGIVR